MRGSPMVWGKVFLGAGLLIIAGMVAMSGIDFAGAPSDSTRADSVPIHKVGDRKPAGGSLGTLIVPVRGVTAAALADTFTDARSEGRSHDAIDIMAPAGTPVVAAADGRVEKLFVSKAGGNTVYVRSSDGERIYYYAHLARYAAGLQEQQTIKQGQPIGEVGSTGNADPTAPHLHFAVLVGARDKPWWDVHDAINPYDLLVGNRDMTQ